MQRFIIEMGMGNDLPLSSSEAVEHKKSGDYQKAAARAIEDAIRHSSFPMLASLNIDPAQMQVRVTVAVQQPDQIDTEALKAGLPRGTVTVTATHGGLDITNPDTGEVTVIAQAAVEAFLPAQ